MKKNEKNAPDYVKIYSDIIDLKYPDRKDEFVSVLSKKQLTFLDVIELNHRLFGCTKSNELSQKLRSYNKKAILDILDYQKKQNLTNSQIAMHFKMSRNTISKWRKIYI